MEGFTADRGRPRSISVDGDTGADEKINFRADRLVPDGGESTPPRGEGSESTSDRDEGTRSPSRRGDGGSDVALSGQRTGYVDSHLRLRALDEAPIGVTITDPDRPDNPLIYVNRSFEELTGYDAEEVLGRNCRFLQGPATEEAPVAAIRAAIEEERSTTVELRNYRKDGTEFWNEVTIAPLRNEAGEVTNFVGFQVDVTDKKRAENAVVTHLDRVKRERQHLTHVLDRIDGLLSDVTDALVQATTRDEIERAVCDRLSSEDAYDAVWIGAYRPGSDAVVPRVRSGAVDPDRQSVGREAERSDPVSGAIADRTVHVGLDSHPSSPEVEGRAMAAIPLTEGDTLYGVLVVHARRSELLDDRELTVLSAIGRAISTAYGAIERRRVLSAQATVELEWILRDDRIFFVSLSSRLDCSLAYEGCVPRTNGTLLSFFTIEGKLTDQFVTLAEECLSVDRVRPLSERGDSRVIEFTLSDSSLLARFLDRGARVTSMSATDGVGRIGVELPESSDPRSVAEWVESCYESVDLVAYRESERPPRTKVEYLDAVERRLTERQLTALRKAYVSGYFDRPRPISGDELAESMDITRSTFHQHLRAAERKLLEEFFTP